MKVDLTEPQMKVLFGAIALAEAEWEDMRPDTSTDLRVLGNACDRLADAWWKAQERKAKPELPGQTTIDDFITEPT